MRKLLLIGATFLFVCCSSSGTVNELQKNAATKSEVENNTDKSVITTTKTPETEKFNDAPTLTPVVIAYYNAVKNKDEKALRSVLSSDTLKALEEDMKSEKKKSLIDYVAEIENTDTPYQVRNEKIEGDRAVAEIKGGNYAVWTKFFFVKENGQWKITDQSPEIEKR
ncbi:MAG: hypothetical protein D6687_02435 [Acidobacteria bacterium]|jgi:hypothetical protein|nr:MAG: hypothetical protein D6687_02435 [Acidobacteriota bacterium]GIU81770.1 MAG: hypothetical protein KatS3mg006_0834 [Pyrinomonadaceae bacterium]